MPVVTCQGLESDDDAYLTMSSVGSSGGISREKKSVRSLSRQYMRLDAKSTVKHHNKAVCALCVSLCTRFGSLLRNYNEYFVADSLLESIK